MLWLLAVFSVCSCDDAEAPDCLKRTGKMVKQARKVGRVRQLFLYDDMDLNLATGTDSVITVEAGENLLPAIETLQTGDSLTIRNNNRCNWVRSYRKPLQVTLYIPPHTDFYLTHYGAGRVQCLDSLQLDYAIIASFDGGGNIDIRGNLGYISIYSNSPAHISLTGRSDQTEIWLNRAIGRVSAEKLISQNCKIRHSGSNEIRVFPIKELQAEITENGTVAYYNEPLKITSTITGRGKLVRRF